jgi:hypothetical protein
VPQYARVCHRSAGGSRGGAPHRPPSATVSAESGEADSSCLSTTPPYENLAFHKVTINVPDKNGGGGGGGGGGGTVEGDRQRHVQRNPPLRKSKVPLKYQGIKRVKSRGREEEQQQQQQQQQQLADHTAEKTGYSQKEGRPPQ